MQDLSRISLVAFDVDGVFTDGRILIAADGSESKSFNVRDGFGVKRLLKAGKQVAIISGRDARAVDFRMRELGVTHVFQGCKDKLGVLDDLLSELNLSRDRVAYVGDDLPDLEVMQAVGLSIAVADAAPELLQAAAHVTRAAGGRGAVREVCDMLLDGSTE
jgi:3-deoxy-D-manno-octulosonate 8-phosphate phosphatase (KDO 8-P phosphatase)